MTTISQLMVKVGADVADAEKGLGRVSDRIGGIGKQAAITGAAMTAGLTLPIVGVAKSALDVAVDYQSAMNIMGAVSGATAEQMGKVGEKAKELGADVRLPATSAGDAALAMVELSKAGLSVAESMDAARGVLQLSAAGAISNAQAAEVAANAVNAFGLEASKTVVVADLFAAAANASSVEVKDVADSFKMAAAVFSAFQGPVVGADQAIVDLTGAIGLLGNMGIKGSDAGTSIKQSLLQLTAPSKTAKELMASLAQRIGETGDIAYDAQGNMRAYSDIIRLTAKATADMTDEERNFAITQIYGADASRAVIALMRSMSDEAALAGKSWADMDVAITRQGAAAELAGARMKGLGGAMGALQSTVETVALELAEPFLGALEGAVRGISDLVGKLPEVDRGLLLFGAGLVGVLAIAGPALAVFGGLATALAFLMSPIGLVVGALALLGGAFAADLGGVRSAITAFVEGGGDFEAAAKEIQRAIGVDLAPAFRLLEQALSGDVGGAMRGVVALAESQLPILWAKFEGWARAAWGWLEPAGRKMLEMASAFAVSVLDFIGQEGPPLARKFITEWVPGAVNWVLQAGIDFAPAALSFLGSVLDWVRDNAPEVARKFFSEWVPTAVLWVGEAAVKVVPKLAEFLWTVTSWIVTEGVPKVLSTALEMGKAVVTGMVQGMAKLGGALWNAITSAIKGIDVDFGWIRISGQTGVSFNIPMPQLGGGGGGGSHQEGGAEYSAWVAAGSPDWSRDPSGGMNVYGEPIHRQFGGPVWPGGSFLVGEGGPELFRPRASGYISPVAAPAGGATVNIFVQGNTLLGDDRRVAKELAEVVRAELVRKGFRGIDIFGGLA